MKGFIMKCLFIKALAILLMVPAGCSNKIKPIPKIETEKVETAYEMAITEEVIAYPEDVEAIIRSGILRVGVKNDVIGFGFQDPISQEYTGLEIDIAKKIGSELGVAIAFVPVTASTRMALLDSGELDMVIATFTITDERRERWDFTEPYYTDFVTVLVEDASGIKVLEHMYGLVVGVSLDTTSARALVSKMIEKGIITAEFDEETFNPSTWTEGITFRQYGDYPTISTALSTGEVDAFCVDKSILSFYNTEGRSYIEDKFSPQDYGIATKKESGLSNIVNDFMITWLEDGSIRRLTEANGLH